MGQDDQDGKGEDPGEVEVDETFDMLKSQDTRNERRIFWNEVAIIHVIALLAAAYLVAALFSLGDLRMPRW
jgi:hypothetical protein